MKQITMDYEEYKEIEKKLNYLDDFKFKINQCLEIKCETGLKRTLIINEDKLKSCMRVNEIRIIKKR